MPVIKLYITPIAINITINPTNTNIAIITGLFKAVPKSNDTAGLSYSTATSSCEEPVGWQEI